MHATIPGVNQLRAVALATLVGACGETPGAVHATVRYQLASANAACVQVRVSPDSPAGQSEQSGLSLVGRPLDGKLQFGILPRPQWQGALTITASLHRPACTASPVVSQTRQATIRPGGVTPLDFELVENSDAGDAGRDAGELDAGSDAGSDGGSDAGKSSSCDGGLVLVKAPRFTWRDVAPFGTQGQVWLAGAGSLQWGRAGVWHANTTDCQADHFAAWAAPSGRVFVGSIDAGLQHSDPVEDGGCLSLPTPGDVGTIRSIVGFEDAGEIVLYSASSAATLLRNSDPAQPTLDRRWDFADAGIFEFWTVDGIDADTLFAGGTANNGKGAIFKYAKATDTWVLQSLPNTGTVNDISVVSPTLAFAGTENADLFRWNGTTWTRVSNAFGRAIYGVKAFSATQVYVAAPGARAGLWDGTAWSIVADFDGGPGGYLARIRGVNSCELWGGGTTGLLVSSP